MLRKLAATLAVAALCASTAAAEDQPPQTTLGHSNFIVNATFTGLTPGDRYEFTATAHFEDGDTYWLGGTWGAGVRDNGNIVLFMDVADLAYWDRGKPIEWVRLCLRPPGSGLFDEVPAADGLPLCLNVDTGDYRYGEYEETVYGDTAHALKTAETVRASKRGLHW